jgi:hypothetical protein
MKSFLVEQVTGQRLEITDNGSKLVDQSFV